MEKPSQEILAIVGRPNVGKSALFNRIVGRRVSIVHEEAGVTRDRVSASAHWRDRTFEVVDTGGIAFLDREKSADFLATESKRQAELAIAMATSIILVVDVTAGITPLDLDIAGRLRASGKRIVVAVNKVDNRERDRGTAEFAELGFEKVFPIAAVHGIGISPLLDAATEDFAPAAQAPETEPTKIAIVGRPNVGKSSLINSLLQSERTIVSDVPGTTRDSVDVPFRANDQDYLLIDTAGLKHRRKIRTSVDQFGLMRAERSIAHCNVAVMVLDATAKVTKGDKQIAGQIAEAGCGCVLLVNKWDLMKGNEKELRRQYLEGIHQELFFLDWADILFTSAKTGDGVDLLMAAVARIEKQMTTRIETPELNRLLIRATQGYPPPMVHGKRLKIFYAFHKPGHPPTVTMFVNDRRCVTPHYERFLIDRIRSKWAFQGCPVWLEYRQKERMKPAKKRAI